MKIVHIVKQDPDATAKTIMDIHRKSHDVTVVDIRQNKNYEQLVDLIFTCDKVISW